MPRIVLDQITSSAGLTIGKILGTLGSLQLSFARWAPSLDDKANLRLPERTRVAPFGDPIGHPEGFVCALDGGRPCVQRKT